jgi:hypothetical protein
LVNDAADTEFAWDAVIKQAKYVKHTVRRGLINQDVPRPTHAIRTIRRTASAVPDVVSAQGAFDLLRPIAQRIIGDILHGGDYEGGVTVAPDDAPTLQTIRQDLGKLFLG